MRTSRDGSGRAGRGLLLAAVLLGSGLLGPGLPGPASALDAVARLPVPPAGAYRNAREAVRTGVRDYNAGDKEGAARALEYAAGQGHALALWKLGRMYAEGDGVPHDDLKAFEFFSKIADENADDGPDSTNATVVASAFTALGRYFLDGIKGSYVQPNVERAYDMFNYAATYFGDPNAQYNLARLYLDGTGVTQDPRQAARWFNPRGREGPPGSPGAARATADERAGRPGPARPLPRLVDPRRDAAEGPKDQWIVGLQEQALAAASERDRADAQAQSTGSTAAAPAPAPGRAALVAAGRQGRAERGPRQRGGDVGGEARPAAGIDLLPRPSRSWRIRPSPTRREAEAVAARNGPSICASGGSNSGGSSRARAFSTTASSPAPS